MPDALEIKHPDIKGCPWKLYDGPCLCSICLIATYDDYFDCCPTMSTEENCKGTVRNCKKFIHKDDEWPEL